MLAYRGVDKRASENRDYEGYPITRIKYAFQVLEVIRVNLVEPNPTFDFIPETFREVDSAEALSHIIPYQLKRDRFAHKQNVWIEDDFICGINVGKTAWRKQTVIRGGKNVTIFNQPTNIPVDPRTFFPDPSAPTSDYWGYVFQETYLSAEQLKYMATNGGYDSAVVNSILSKGQAQDANGRKKGYCVVEFWTQETFQTFSDQGILKNSSNELLSGQIPFFCGSTIPRSRSVFGIPEVELVKEPQSLLWALDNMGLETLKYNSRPVVGFRRDRVGSAEVRANMRPGGAVPFGTPEDLQIFFQGGNAQLIFQRKSEALADIQNVTGASSYLAGSDSQQYGVNQQTATGISILEAGASKRMNHRKANLEEFYSSMVKAQIKLNAQFLPGDLELKIRSGQSYVPMTVSREDISGEFGVVPRWLNQGSNEEANLQSLSQMFNTLAPLALNGYVFPDGSKLDIRPLVEKMMDARRWNHREFFAGPDQQNDMGGPPLSVNENPPNLNSSSPASPAY